MEEKKDFGYYSKLLKVPFDTYEALVEAEKIYEEEEQKKLKEKNDKREEAENVERAYKDYVELTEKLNRDLIKFQCECYDKINDAKKVYVNLRDEFIEKYGSFHMTFLNEKSINEEGKEEDSTEVKCDTSEFFNTLFDVFKEFPW